MELRELKYIAAIGQKQNMAQAAQELYISQQALYKSLRKIEDELGTTLFCRRENELLPTDTGQIVLEKSTKIFKYINQMHDEIAATKNLEQGKVCIGLPSVVASMYMPEPLIQFQKKYPNISLRTVETGGNALAGMVTAGTIDMAIIMRPVYMDTLNELPLIRNQVAAGISPSHPWAKRSFITIKDLENTPFITFDETFNMRAQLTERFNAEHIYPKIAFEGANCQFLSDLSALSDNILVLPRPIIEYYAREPVVTLPFKPAFIWELTLVYPKNTFLSTASKALIRHIQEYFSLFD